VRYKPSIIALDYETALTDGTPSIEFYRDDFRAISAAAAWHTEAGEIKTRYMEGEAEIAPFLARCKAEGIPFIAHNLAFEYGVTRFRFPGHEHLFTVDTARLVQVYDNGGDKYQRYERFAPTTEYEGLDNATDPEKPAVYYSGFSLVNSAGRILPGYVNHKAKFYAIIRSRASAGKQVKPGMEGSNLNLLTPEELEVYNVEDAITTLNLYKFTTEYFNEIGYNWRLDHSLYVPLAQEVSEAKARGIAVDREALRAHIATLEASRTKIALDFLNRFKDQIAALEAESLQNLQMGFKTQKGKDAVLARNDHKFNINSTTQLKRLFVDKLGLTPRFFTEDTKAGKAMRLNDPTLPPFEPKPSFKAAHLGSFGEGGEMLVKNKKILLVINQARALLALSERDGLWHASLKMTATSTGRLAGGT
jgi:hypothetical protein